MRRDHELFEDFLTLGWAVRVTFIILVLMLIVSCSRSQGIQAADLPPACTEPPTVAGYPPQFCEEGMSGLVCAYAVSDCYAVLIREGCVAEWATWAHGCQPLTPGEEKTESSWEGTL